MNRNKKIIAWLLLIIWMTIIFLMSHQIGEVSSSQSDIILKIFSLLGIELNQFFGELATLIVRKAAHFSEYLILFLLAYNVSRFYVKGRKIRLLLIVFVFLYACTDEVHQYFIPGRNMAVKDVFIDTLGGVFGYIILDVVEKFKSNNKK
ncbi:MAG: VanZ family protein [Clostridium sartagoforme]|nr:VanZ family protein [Clostridium sartagoforme]